MHVLFVSSEFPPYSLGSGGIGTHFAAFATGLRRLGHEVTVLTEAADDSSTSDGVRVIGLNRASNAGPLSPALRAARVSRIAGRIPCDILVAPEWGGEAAFVRSNPPLVTVLETSMAQAQVLEPDSWRAPRARAYAQVQRWLERRQTLRSASVIGSSHAIAAWTTELWAVPPERMSVLPNFLDMKAISARARAPRVHGDDRPYVFFFGRLEARKGVHVLVRAMREIWTRHPEVQLLFAGADRTMFGQDAKAYLTDLAGADAKKLVFLGPLPQDELLPLVRDARATVFPSLWENFSLAGLEAMAAKGRIIASSAGGFPDFLEHEREALLVDPEDDAALAAALARLIDDEPAAAALAQRAYERAHRDFDLLPGTERFVREFERVRLSARR